MHEDPDCGNHEKVLHSNNIGSIIQCIHCGDLLIKVENILYSTDVKGYYSLFKLIYNIRNNIEDHTVEILSKNYILVCTPNENINLCFSSSDFDLLIDLFEQTRHMLELNKLLNLS